MRGSDVDVKMKKAPGEGPARIHQEGDGGDSTLCAGRSAGEAADGAQRPPGGGVDSE